LAGEGGEVLGGDARLYLGGDAVAERREEVDSRAALGGVEEVSHGRTSLGR
jgi:hypothetical protein